VASLSEFADVAHGHAYAALQMTAASRVWGKVDCAVCRALSLTFRLTNHASLSSALSKARFLHSHSLLRLSLASLLCCAFMIHVHVQVEVKG